MAAGQGQREQLLTGKLPGKGGGGAWGPWLASNWAQALPKAEGQKKRKYEV